MAVKSQPDGYHAVTPYLTIRGAAAAIEFYKAAFGATEVMRLPMPDGTLAHAEIQIGDSKVMFADENPSWGNLSPATLGGCSGGVMLYVPDVDAAFAQAVAAGAAVQVPVTNMFYGDRTGSVIDPFGHKWTLSTHIEDVPPDEMAKRMEAWAKE